MRALNVAVLDEELPFPLTSGKRIRTYNLLARLADRHRVTLLCRKNPDRREAATAERAFRALGIGTVVVDHAVPPKSGPGFYARLAGNLLSPLPYSVSSHASRSLADAVHLHAAENRVDVWHCEWTPYAQVLRDAFGPRLGEMRWSVMAHNVESLIWRRFAETTDNPMKRWYIRRQLRKFERFERWAYSAATAAIAVSRDDAHLMRTEFGATRVSVVDNGVDVSYFRANRDVERDPARMLFMGSLDWRPNQDAAALLLSEILPAVRAADPRARAVLVGRRPPAWLRDRVEMTPGAELHADVPDVRPFLARCGFLIVPLRIGGGSRLKILEALAAGTPVVSTRVGAEGLDLAPGRDLLIADSREELVSTALAAIRRPDELADTAESGRRQVLARYSWDLLAERLNDVWAATAGLPTPTRSARPSRSVTGV
jgi:glycosyltransferase involved in cell wall biosynthesis